MGPPGPPGRPGGLWREARRRERLSVREASKVERLRSLSFSWDEELRVLWLQGMLPAEQGAAVREAIERRSEEIVLADRPDDPRGARMADALVELCTGASGGSRPEAPRPRSWCTPTRRS